MTWDGTLPAHGELIYDSRPLKLDRTSINQTFTFSIILDHTDVVASAANADFMGASDDIKALEILWGFIPETRYVPDSDGTEKLCVLNSVEIKQDGPYEWIATCEYVYDVNKGQGGGRGGTGGTDTLDYIKMTFDIGGGTKNVTQAESTVSSDLPSYSPLGQAPDVGNAIGVTADGVEGVDVPSSSFRLQITGYYFPSTVTFSFGETIRDLIAGTKNKGTYNDSTYLGYEAGEVSLLHATGGGTVVDIIPITFDFDIKRNISNESDGLFPNLTMLGHEVLWYSFAEYEDANGEKVCTLPEARYRQRVKEAANYDLLLLPGA